MGLLLGIEQFKDITLLKTMNRELTTHDTNISLLVQ
jgi:hypothetical protein